MSEIACLKVPKASGGKALTLVRRMGLLNREFKIQQEQDALYIPLIRQPLTAELNELKAAQLESEVSVRTFLKRIERPPKLFDLLADQLPPHIAASLPRAIDFIGDIAVVEIMPEMESYKEVIGEAILKAHKKVRTVLAKSGAVSGAYRLRKFEFISGEAETKTVHKEYGCVFHVDLARVYFSPRLSYEHNRVASLVEEGETVVDMFAGVDAFSILIAKRHEKVRVYAIDLNPDAVKYLKKNVVVNRVEVKVKPFLGDARQIIHERLKGVANRVIMNLPEKAIQYVDAACEAIKPEGGVIHYYEFSNTREPLETAKRRLINAVNRTNRRLENISLVRIVRGVAPFTYQVAVDAEIK